MKNDSMGRMARLLGVLLIAAVVVAASVPAMAERPIRRAGQESAIGGLTVAEQAAARRELHAEISAMLPAGVGLTPVSVEITQADRDDLAVPPISGYAPLRIGVVKSIPKSVGKPFGRAFNRGVVENDPDGRFVWAMTVTSPGAQAIRVRFTGFSLPDNTEMFLLGSNDQAHGPYTGEGRNGNGDFWTRSIVGDSGQVVLRYDGDTPGIDRPNMSFVVQDVGHIRGRKPPRSQTQTHDNWPCADNAACVVDVNCTNTGPAGPAEDAVAKMEWIQGPFINTCSGGLLADTDTSSQIPYFLTANHCFSSSISNLETFFNYTTTSCNGGCPDSLVTGGTPPPASTIGITVVANGSAGDFNLTTLNQAPPAGAVFLGWNNSPVAFTDGANLYRISNANFGPQVYSQHDVDANSPQCSGWPRGQRIYSVDQTGATMGGSSGSPVLNSASEVVGQLSGCCGFNCGDECDPGSNWTVDGALAYYWDSVSEFLDPQGGCTSDAECDDGLFCTGPEACKSGSCSSSGDPCSGGAVCNEATDSCDVGCTSDAECDDGLFCTGSETCTAGSCSSAGDPCTGGTVCNETTGMCDPPVCNDDGTCGPGEDCNNCPNDCRGKQNGNPNGRFCCNGDQPDCGDSRCSEPGWSCGGGGSCTSDPECDDGQFCTGIETCSSGTCQGGSDPCPGESCDEGSDQCVSCGGNKDPCNSDGDCCSNNCKNGSCKGN